MTPHKAKLLELMKKKHKYSAIPLVVDGIRFASTKEARWYKDLKLLEKVGEIKDLKLQPVFNFSFGGVDICKYIADFCYTDKLGKSFVVDAKGVRTPLYRIKKKMVKAFYGIDIVEV